MKGLAKAAVLLLALTACRPAPEAPPAPHPRVVSLLPNATEVLFALGAGDHLVGATRYCDRPEAARAVPRVGGILDVSVEAVLAARPDVVIGSPTVLGPRFRALLAEAGARVVPLTFETTDSIAPGILAVGEAVGREAEARTLADGMRADLELLGGRARRDPPVRVLFVVGRNPLVVAARPSFLGDLLDRMGVANLASSESVPFPTWSLEQVLKADPDVVVDGAVEAGDVGAMLAAAGLRAAREGRVVRMPDDAIIRPGPASARAALRLADEVLRVAKGM